MQGALVERVRETERLHGLLSAAAGGDGRIVLIEGAAGLGKTRLLTETRARARADGLLVLSARGSELEQEFAFGVVRQLLEGQLADPAVREAALAGPAAAAESVFGAPVEASIDGEAAPDASFATLHSLYWLVLNLAERGPILIAVDDLQWCDRASLQFIAYLGVRIDGQPILLASTLRTGESWTESSLLAEILAGPANATIQPALLSADAVTELIRERLGPNAEPEFCAACHVATGGNPLLLGRVLGALRADDVRPVAANASLVADVGPSAVARTVAMQLARLPDAATTVARAVAVLGDGADLRTIAAYAGVDAEVVATAAGNLSRAEILTSEAPLAFVHPLVRDAVYHGLSTAEREFQHARAADLAIAAGAPGERVAAQLLKAARRGEGWVVERLIAAARAAVAQGSPHGAVAYLSRALEEPPPPAARPQILLELGLAEGLTSGPDAVEHLRAACAAMEDAADRALAAPVLAPSLIFTGAPEQAAAFASDTAAQLPADHVDLIEVLEAIELGTTMFGMSEPDQIRRLQAYRSRPVGNGPGAKMLAALTAWEWAMTGGDAEACAELARAALADDTMVAADNGFLTVPAIGVLFLGDLDEAPLRWDRLLADSHADGSLFAISCVHLWNGITQLRRGELAEAEDLVRMGRGELALWGELPVDGAYFTSQLALIRLERGHVSDARQELGPRPSRAFDAYDAAHLWLRSEVEVLLAEGHDEQALAHADAYGAIVGRLSNPAWVPWRSLRAVALGRLGRTTEAMEEAEREVAHARAWGAPGTVGRSLRILGTVQGDDGAAALEESIAVLDGSAARLELAKALAAYGALLRRTGQAEGARTPLRRALELAERCGADGLAAEARTELYAAGSRPRSAALSGPGALTVSERRVAALAADGLTNRDIAQRLFVTPKTVEVHLSASYRKLGIASRHELAGTLATA